MKKFRNVLVVLIAGLLLWALFRGPSEPEITNGSTLVIDIDGVYVEATRAPFLSRLIGEVGVPFAALRSELKKAARDDRLETVVLRIRMPQVGWAQAQELRGLIAELRNAGRNTVAYLETQTFVSNIPYYIASAADQIQVSPAAVVGLIGLAGEYFFLGGAAEQLGIEFEVARIGRYKAFADFVAGQEMSDAYREAADSILDSVYGQFVAGIAAGREVSEDFVRTAIDTAPMDPDELLAMDLIDEIAFFDEMLDAFGGPRVDAADYARVDPASVGFAPVAQFAMIYGSGNVVVGRGRATAAGGPVAASDSVIEAFEDAVRDPAISAIIFRIDSPGGSPLAADMIWRAVELAKQRGKPVIASMSNAAASGGYYVVGGADAIVASPATITGSIGVVAIRPVIRELLDKLDIGSELLKRGKHADMFTILQPMSDEGRARFGNQIRSTYDLFVERVAAGRGMSYLQVDAIARGRVWTGAQAQRNGLVDSVGGLDEAVRIAKQKVGIDEDADVALVPFPAPATLAEQINETLQQVVIRAIPIAPLPALARRVRLWLEAASWETPMLLPPFVVEIR